MTSHAEKAVDVAGKVAKLATDALSNIDFGVRQWPAEYRAIVYDAIAAAATKRAEIARNEIRFTTAERT